MATSSKSRLKPAATLFLGLMGLTTLLFLTVGCGKPDLKPETEIPPDEVSPIKPPEEFVQKPIIKIPVEKPLLIQPLHQDAFFMGTQARGQRFCIIADASNSMKGPPLSQLKKEILKTLDGLKPTSYFYLIFFNATDIPMPHPTWLAADKDNLDKIKPWIENTTLALHTKPTSAFNRAFKLDPKPDAIFFMTDGFLQGFSTSQVARLNAAQPKVVVHTLMLTRKSPEKTGVKANKAQDQLRVLAEENGGTFRQVGPH